MSYFVSQFAILSPTTDELVLTLRQQRELALAEVRRIEHDLEILLPPPICRLCHRNECHGTLDWTVCIPCWHQHRGNPPPATEDPQASGAPPQSSE